MSFQLPWVRNKKQKVKHEGTRDHNTEEENELLEIAEQRFHLADTSKVDFQNEHLHRKWRRFDEIYRSQQWQEVVPEDRSAPVLNFIFAIIQSLVPRLTDNNPKVHVQPRQSPDDKGLADKIQAALDYLWYTNYMRQERLREAVIHMLKYGTALFKIVWNPELKDGLGDVEYTVVHPMNFYPDPRAYTLEDMDYYFVKMPKSIEYIMRRWPNKGHVVIPDSDWHETEDLQGRAKDTGEEVATLVEYGFRDEDGNVCIMYYAGHVVLDVFGGRYDEDEEESPEAEDIEEDEEKEGEPVYPHNKFPFAKMVDYPSEKEFWGIGEIEVAEIAQRLINSFEAQMIDNTRMMANSQWIVNKAESGLDEADADMLDNSPGSAIFTHNGGVDRIPGVPIPAHIPQHLESLIFWLEQILGVHDVVQGRQPEGVRAASAIIALQEAANVRVKEKANHMEAAIRQLSEQAISLILDNYEEDRMVRVAGDSVPTTLNVREALEERVLDMAQEAGMVAPQQPMGMGEGMIEGPGMEGPGMQQQQMMPEDPMAQEMQMEELMTQVKYPEFDIEIDVGASIPQSQALLYEQAKEFFQLGVVDRQAVLEVTNFPNAEEILSRMEQQEQAMMGQEEPTERVGERTR